MNKVNYQKELDRVLCRLDVTRGSGAGQIKCKRLLLHACCAPCSSYCLEYLSEYFEITVLFYNPNINSDEEYRRRAAELKRFIDTAEFHHGVDYVCEDFVPDEFYGAVRGLEHCAEGGERCFACYELRMRRAAQMAVRGKYDYFCTTLSISPLKNADKINEIGMKLSEEYGVLWLPSDFKKKNGFKRSVELSEIYGLYRQDYCGCVFSK